jgi:asparagine synthetase B (glutamine-hydrolysing)
MSSEADPDITFNAEGICNHCQRYDNLVDTRIASPATRDQEFKALIERIKHDGKGKEYDCLVGVSGGVDSSLALRLLVAAGHQCRAFYLQIWFQVRAREVNPCNTLLC